MAKETVKKCPVCGKEWSYQLRSGDGWCQHDDNVASNYVTEEMKYLRHLDKREKILEAHHKGKLSKSHYTKDKKTGRPVLSPKKLMSRKHGL